MKRNIITINEGLCNGCGQCVGACHEGALQIINGKAKLVREDFCDGLGACLGECPTGALVIEEKDVPAFDEEGAKMAQEKTLSHIQQKTLPCGCPGTAVRHNTSQTTLPPVPANTRNLPPAVIASDLKQWPVQLHLVNPHAPYFTNSELVVLSTCSPIASADVHWRFIRGRAVVVACPKLDNTEGYIEKLAQIFVEARTPKVLVVLMEVPCCNGLSHIVKEAIKLSKRSDLMFEEITVTLDGLIK